MNKNSLTSTWDTQGIGSTPIAYEACYKISLEK